MLPVSVQGLAGVVSLIDGLHCCEGQHATPYHSSRTNPVPWTSCNHHTITLCWLELLQIRQDKDKKQTILLKLLWITTKVWTNHYRTVHTNPFNGRGWISGCCTAKLCPLALLDIQHRGSDCGYRLGPLCSYRRRHISQIQLKMESKTEASGEKKRDNAEWSVGAVVKWKMKLFQETTATAWP